MTFACLFPFRNKLLRFFSLYSWVQWELLVVGKSSFFIRLSKSENFPSSACRIRCEMRRAVTISHNVDRHGTISRRFTETFRASLVESKSSLRGGTKGRCSMQSPCGTTVRRLKYGIGLVELG